MSTPTETASAHRVRGYNQVSAHDAFSFNYILVKADSGSKWRKGCFVRSAAIIQNSISVDYLKEVVVRGTGCR